MGIVVDHRRRSKSEEGQKLNVERLKEYRSRLVVFPRKAGKPKSGDAQVSSNILLQLTKQGEDLTAHITRTLPGLPSVYESEAPRAIESEEKEASAFRSLREARAGQRSEGARQKRLAAKAAEE